MADAVSEDDIQSTLNSRTLDEASIVGSNLPNTLHGAASMLTPIVQYVTSSFGVISESKYANKVKGKSCVDSLSRSKSTFTQKIEILWI